MQNYTPPGGWGPVLHFLHENRMAIQGALTAFFIALLFSLWDGVMANAEAIIAPLARAVKYGIATEEEAASLEAWELYTVKLNRVTLEKTEQPCRFSQGWLHFPLARGFSGK